MVGGGGVRAFSIAMAVGLTALGAVACGSEEEPPPPEPRHALTGVVHQLQDRFDAEDLEGVCALMTREAQVQAGDVGHGQPTACPRDLRRALGMIDGGGGWLDGDKPRVSAVRERGRKATVVLAADDWSARVPFANEGDGWKLAGFFGMNLREFERLEDRYPSRPFPPAAGRAVHVTTDGRSDCGTVYLSPAYPELKGGCVVRVTNKKVPIKMLTPFGGFEFDTCSVSYRVSIDSYGRTWTDEFEVGRVGNAEGGCADVNPCLHAPQVRITRLPWKGRIRSDGNGGFTHHVDMCVRTCIGMFVGEMVVELTPDDDARTGWRAEGDEGGSTGYRYDGAFAITGDPLKISPYDGPARKSYSGLYD